MRLLSSTLRTGVLNFEGLSLSSYVLVWLILLPVLFLRSVLVFPGPPLPDIDHLCLVNLRVYILAFFLGGGVLLVLVLVLVLVLSWFPSFLYR